MKRLRALAVLTLLVTCVCLLSAPPAWTQGTLRPDCAVRTLDIKTGLDEATNTVLAPGAVDQSWMVLSDPDPGTVEPRPAAAITRHPAWGAPLPGTQWISSYGTADNNLNGKYVFETCFCLRPGYEGARLKVSVMADDLAEVFLNGTSIGQTAGTPYNFSTPTTLQAHQPFQPGRNCLRVEVTNTGSVAMGFNLSATLQTPGASLEKPECCNATGGLYGRKWNDVNGDGVKQASEPALPGWLIKLSNNAATLTDANGYYYFINLPPGSYTVAEQAQPGWQQTFPLSGKHTVTLAAGQGVSNLDFGNRRCSQCTEGQVVFVPAGSPAAGDLCARLCCEKGEYFFQNSCGCGCSTKPPCPELGAPGVHYVAVDPAVCAAIKFTCGRGQTSFSNECGCGCRSSIRELPDDRYTPTGPAPVPLPTPPGR